MFAEAIVAISAAVVAALDGVPPRLSVDDVTHHRSVDAVLSSEFALIDTASSIAGADVADLLGCQLRLPIPLAARKQPFACPVLEVVTTCPVEQMLRADTGRGVAMVAAIVAGGKRPFGQLVGESVSRPSLSMGDTEESIAVSRLLPSPNPTRSEMRHVFRDRSVLIDLQPETDIGRNEAVLVRSHGAIVPLCFTSSPSCTGDCDVL